jgi:hypothetical protein
LVLVPVAPASSLITCVCVNLAAAAMYFSLSVLWVLFPSVWFYQFRLRRLKHNRAELFPTKSYGMTIRL